VVFLLAPPILNRLEGLIKLGDRGLNWPATKRFDCFKRWKWLVKELKAEPFGDNNKRSMG
jgi:hypothetical protein